jgi:DNA-binding MarR family transcriptional regulator
MGDPTGQHTRQATGGDLDPEQVGRLRLVIARLHRQMAQASGSQDLTFAQLSALARIEQRGPIRLGELATREGVSAPSMTRTITPLSAAGLIGKAPDPEDGRSFLVAITATGRKTLARMRRERSALLSRRIDRLDQEQREALAAAIPILEILVDETAAHDRS